MAGVWQLQLKLSVVWARTNIDSENWQVNLEKSRIRKNKEKHMKQSGKQAGGSWSGSINTQTRRDKGEYGE